MYSLVIKIFLVLENLYLRKLVQRFQLVFWLIVVGY